MDINDGHDEASYSGVTGTRAPWKGAEERISQQNLKQFCFEGQPVMCQYLRFRPRSFLKCVLVYGLGEYSRFLLAFIVSGAPYAVPRDARHLFGFPAAQEEGPVLFHRVCGIGCV